jgi:16S rRNA (guanine527-N7)-methyltransferase
MGTFRGHLARENERQNLTAIVTEAEFWTLHVCDSLAFARVRPDVLTAPLRIADVGCGGGFPLLALAWANPSLSLTGIEPRKSKAAFVAAEADRLGLDNVSVEDRQAREAGRAEHCRGAFCFVLLRAVGTAGKMTREVRHLLADAPGAAIVFYKTPESIEREMPLARREADKYGLALQTSDVIQLPHEGGARQFLLLVRP